MNVWNDPELHQFIKEQARRHSRKPEVQEDFKQEAWLCISLEDYGDKTCECYKGVALRAIQKSYQRERRYRINREQVMTAFQEEYANKHR